MRQNCVWKAWCFSDDAEDNGKEVDDEQACSKDVGLVNQIEY